MVFDESLQRCLDSYLHHAPRGLDIAASPSSPAVAEMQRSVHRMVFLTFLRMATHKESKVGGGGGTRYQSSEAPNVFLEETDALDLSVFTTNIFLFYFIVFFIL